MTQTQTNTWLGGMNYDVDPIFLDSSQYIYSENMRVITTTGVVQQIEGTDVDAITYPADEVIIGTTTIGNIGIIITKVLQDGEYYYNKIYRTIFDNESIISQTIILQGDLGLGKGSIDNNEYSRVSVVGNYETDTNIKIYFTDGSGQTKILNVVDDKYVGVGPDNPLLDTNGWIINPGALDSTPDATLPPFGIVSLGSGNLLAGMVQYAYQLFNVRGTISTLSPLSELIHLTASNTTQDSQDYIGTSRGQSSNKSCLLQASLVSPGFQKCRIIRIHYDSNTELPTIEIIDEIDLTADQTTINYRDTGNSSISVLTVEELNALSGYQFIAKTLEKLDNRLFSANITEVSWNPEYDARAYRCNQAGEVILQSGNEDQTLTFSDISTMNFDSIPETHDCINPFNTLKSSQFTDTNTYEYSALTYTENGSTVRYKGGTGKNVSFRFLHFPMQMTELYDSIPTSTASMNVAPTTFPQTLLWRPDDQNTKILFDAQQATRLQNHADPYNAAKFRSYLRDEVYRFGLVLYNSKGISSPVKWIADIRMPHGSDAKFAPFEYRYFFAVENNAIVTKYAVAGNALGMEFVVTNLPDDAVAFEIVRCERKQEDRTILIQTAVSLLGNYPYANTDTGELGGDLDTRPFLWPTFMSGNIWTDGSSSEVYLPAAQVKTDYYQLTSPEISILGDDSESLFDSSTYLDSLYGLGSYNKEYDGQDTTSRKSLVPTKRIYRYDGQLSTIADSNLQLMGVANRNNAATTWRGIYLMEGTIDGAGVSNYNRNAVYISKLYIPFAFSANQIGKTNTDITQVKYPQLIPWNAMDNVAGYYTNIGNISVLNAPRNKFNAASTTGNLKYGPGAQMLIAQIPNLQDNVYKFTAAGDEFNRSGISIFNAEIDERRSAVSSSVLIANIKRNIIPYGGDTFVARQNSIYISTACYRLKTGTSDVNCFGGDTYLGVLDQPWTRQYQLKDPNTNNYTKTYVGAYILFESNVNLWLLQGDMTHMTYNESNDFINGWLQPEPTQIGDWFAQDKPYFVYNGAYSSQPNSRLYVSSSLYAEDNVISRNRIYGSEAKINNEVIDSWSRTLVANYLDVDNQYGQITNLQVFKNNLFYWQDEALGIAAVNERSLIQDNNVGTLTLGTGGILTRFDYISTRNGDSTINDNSITTSDNIIYWYDFDKKEICNLTGTLVSQLSKEKQVQMYVNRLLDTENHYYLRRDLNSFFDKKYNETYFNFYTLNGDTKRKSLIFNEQLTKFTGAYTISSNNTLVFSDKTVVLRDGNYYYINRGDTNGNVLNDNPKVSQIIFSVNNDPTSTKVFDNVWTGAIFKGTSEIEDKSIFTEAVFNTKTQTSQIVTETELDLREDTYRLFVPRSTETGLDTNLTLSPRMRGKYLISNYKFTTDSNQFEIPYITTSYRNSLV